MIIFAFIAPGQGPYLLGPGMSSSGPLPKGHGPGLLVVEDQVLFLIVEFGGLVP